jgi:hypothetical protein
MKPQTDPNQDVLDLLEGDEHLDLDPYPCYFRDDDFTPASVRGQFYGIGGFGLVQGLDLLFG